MMPEWKWRLLRARNIIAAQFTRRTWARRSYRLALRLHSGPERFTRINVPGFRMLLLENPFDPVLRNVHVLDRSLGGGELTGRLTRDQLEADDFTNACLLVDGDDPTPWAFCNLFLGSVFSDEQLAAIA